MDRWRKTILSANEMMAHRACHDAASCLVAMLDDGIGRDPPSVTREKSPVRSQAAVAQVPACMHGAWAAEHGVGGRRCIPAASAPPLLARSAHPSLLAGRQTPSSHPPPPGWLAGPGRQGLTDTDPHLGRA
ncbi:hypothetical protein RJ55_02204 [Drechmeria coniospora]|nr:hypothetical protein RJ55_02204 [Drechmeria coniospora]